MVINIHLTNGELTKEQMKIYFLVLFKDTKAVSVYLTEEISVPQKKV